MKLHKRISAVLLSALMIAGLAACGSTPAPEKEEEKVLNIFTWATYFPDDIIAEFEEETGIKVNYSNFESNEEMLMKLESTQGGDYDIVLASDYIIDIARGKNLLGELDKSLIPNYENIDPAFQNKFYDPENKFTIPYAAGIPAVIYNPEMVDFEVKGYNDLWNPALKDSVVVVDDARNIVGITLMSMGEKLNTTDPAILEKAKEKLMTLRPNIRALDYSTPYNLMISGETAMGYMFTSQILMALEAAPNLKAVYPEEGLGFGIDSVFMPVNAPHKDSAHAFIDFILEPERSAHISEQTYYINCNKAAAEFVSNPALVAPSELIVDAQFMQDVGEATQIYNDIWTEFKMS